MYDDSGHGTHVAGILAGDGRLSGGTYAGIAPKASLLIAKVLDQDGNGSVESVLEGMRWVLSMRKKLKKEFFLEVEYLMVMLMLTLQKVCFLEMR